MIHSKKTILYWADTDLAFVKKFNQLFESSNLKCSFIRISHHKDWFTNKRSYFSNFWFLLNVLMKGLIKAVNGDLVLFGTNLCRIIFPFSLFFKKIFFVYNELPDNTNKLIYLYDCVIIKNVEILYVSSDERAEYVLEKYKRSKPIKVLLNTPIVEWSLLDKNQNRLQKIIYAGTISSKRFPPRVIKVMRNFGLSTDIYGKFVEVDFKLEEDIFSFLGELENREIMIELRKYSYGLLSYYQDEINYDLCAPIKIYEYIEAGCRVISINNNKGLKRLFLEFPALFAYIENLNSFSSYTFSEYLAQRNTFLKIGLDNNLNFLENFLNVE